MCYIALTEEYSEESLALNTLVPEGSYLKYDIIKHHVTKQE